jgi:hypothetical protein
MKTKKSKSNFRGKITKNAKDSKSNQNNFGYLNLPKDVHVFQPEPGSRVKLDFIPYEVTDNKHSDRDPELEIAIPGTLWYKRPFKTHRNVGSGNDTVVCPSSFGKKCPICEYAQKRAKEGADKEETKELWAKSRNLYIVIPRDSKKHEETPYVWDMSQYLFQNLLNEELEENEEHAVFPDIEEGLTLKIRFETKKMGKNTFEEVARIDFIEREEALDESILEDLPNLDTLLKVLSYDELHAKFFEMEDEPDAGKLEKDEDEDEDEEDEKPVRKKSLERKPAKEEKKVSKKTPEPIEEEDKEQEDEEVEMTWESLLSMSQSKLEKLIEDSELETDPDDFDDDVTSLRKAIAKELGIEIPKDKKKPKNPCTACKGTGLNSRGGKCVICRGTGEKPNEELPDEDEDEEDEKPAKKAVMQRSTKSEKSTKECPSGYRFGIDTDKHDECDTCKLWNSCSDAKDSKKK